MDLVLKTRKHHSVFQDERKDRKGIEEAMTPPCGLGSIEERPASCHARLPRETVNSRGHMFRHRILDSSRVRVSCRALSKHSRVEGGMYRAPRQVRGHVHASITRLALRIRGDDEGRSVREPWSSHVRVARVHEKT